MLEVFVVIGFALIGIVWKIPLLLWGLAVFYGCYVCALLMFNWYFPVVVGQRIKCYDNNRVIVEGTVVDVQHFSLKIQTPTARMIKVSRSLTYLSVPSLK
jgi:hypothetical protein